MTTQPSDLFERLQASVAEATAKWGPLLRNLEAEMAESEIRGYEYHGAFTLSLNNVLYDPRFSKLSAEGVASDTGDETSRKVISKVYYSSLSHIQSWPENMFDGIKAGNEIVYYFDPETRSVRGLLRLEKPQDNVWDWPTHETWNGDLCAEIPQSTLSLSLGDLSARKFPGNLFSSTLTKEQLAEHPSPDIQKEK